MKYFKPALFIVSAAILGSVCLAQNNSSDVAFKQASETASSDLKNSLKELSDLRDQIAKERIPLSKELNRLENKVLEKRREAQRAQGIVDNRTVDLNALKNEVKARQDENAYIKNLMGEYIRSFETRVHIAEVANYEPAVKAAESALDDPNLSSSQVFEKQLTVINAALDRLQKVGGGEAFQGKALVGENVLKSGKFVLAGPVAVFNSDDNTNDGLAELEANSNYPVIVSPGKEFDASIKALVSTASGKIPVDPSMGNAIKIRETRETLPEHIEKGGPVMIFIIGLAIIALIIAIFKWFEISAVKRPKPGDLQAILDFLNHHEPEKALERAKSIPGPFGELLVTGVRHADQEKELLEEVLYERLLATQPKLDRFLAFIGLTAGAEPLLGLLGTVTGMIQTFKLITIFGTGDAKQLSSGISEALITTEYGLYTAIPALLAQALLNRRAKGTLSEMEQTSVAFVNGLTRNHNHASESKT